MGKPSYEELVEKLNQVFKRSTPDQDENDWRDPSEWEAFMEELDHFRHCQATIASSANYINDPVSKRARVYVAMGKMIGDLEYENWELRRRLSDLEKLTS